MPAPEYPRTQNLQPTLLPEPKGGALAGDVLSTLAGRLRDYVKGPAPNQNQRSSNSAGRPGQSTPTTQSPTQVAAIFPPIDQVARAATARRAGRVARRGIQA